MWVQAGVDFGNENFVVAVPGNGVSVVPTPDGGRVVPASVTFTGSRRWFGGDSQREQSANIASTITQLKRLICLPFHSKEREEVEAETGFRLCEVDDETTGVVVPFHDKEIVMRPEQVLAFALRRIDELARGFDERVGSYVVAVSPWWSERHRRAVFDAFKIAGLRCSALVNSTTTAAVAYTMTHGSKLPPDNSVPTLFIDFGNSAMNVAVVNLRQGNVEVLSLAHDTHLGGAYFTDALMGYLMDKVKQKYNVDPTGNPKAMLRFRNAVDKLKKTLSVNPVVQFEIQSLINDVDVSFLVKRDEFVGQIGTLLERIQAPIEKALELANVKKEDLVIIEALGGGSRVPAVKAKIAEVLGKEPTQSLNLEECFAVGSGYIAALMSPGMFRIPLVVKDVSPLSIVAEWSDGHPKSQEVFKQFAEVPSTTTLTVKVSNKTDVKFSSDSEEVARVKLETGVAEALDVTVRLRLTQSSTLAIESASYKKEEEEVPVQFTIEYPTVIPEEKIEEMKKLEQEMTESDLLEVKIDETKNDLEAAMFKLEGEIRDSADYFSPEEIESAQNLDNEVRGWYDENEFERLPLEDYQTRKDKLNEALNPILERKKQYAEILEKVTSLSDSLAKTQKALKDDKKHESDEEAPKLQADIDATNAKLEEFKSIKKYEAKDFDIDSIQNSITDISKRQQALESKPIKKEENWGAKARRPDVIRNKLFGYGDDDDWEDPYNRARPADEDDNLRRRLEEQEDDDYDEYDNPFGGWGPLFGMPARRPPRHPQRARQEQLRQEEERRRRAEAAARAEAERQRQIALERQRQQELLEQRQREEAARRQRAAEMWDDPWGIPQRQPPRRSPQPRRQPSTTWGDPWGQASSRGWGEDPWGSSWNNPFF